MKARIYIVAMADRVDAYPMVVGAYGTRQEALNVIREEIQDWADDRAGEDIEVDFDRMQGRYINADAGCQWTLCETDVDVLDHTCCICGDAFDGYGNNPYPVKHEGRCCSKCNDNVVVPERLRLAGISMKKDL